ncbi:transcriptional regulator, putative [Nitratidesulfovibrio vulgaris str. Hildenborough]|uniref:Transcriptional regulator, putative n=1 Tax=Nitratidesulfovibrio vulgaris (strain ATCC 29579 / DSM 644 / CCUG 34227 / NCIMB 8303 / VKM B-1760 / Hildenborough) TaxID=882 RepID=Q72BW5_NITV2|nr:transcriptional regulator, putative [Nitratidesulfovibrio vulgaris str. Hildenborough]
MAATKRTMKANLINKRAWDSILAKVKDLVEQGMTYSAIGKMLGKSPATVNRWVTTGVGGDSTPFVNMLQYMEALGLKWGDIVENLEPAACGYGYVRKVQAKLGAGSSLITNGDLEGMYAFRQDFINEMGGNPESLVMFDVIGASMEPTIPDGSTVLVNLRDTSIRSGLIYAVRVNDELLVKRLIQEPGRLLCHSDNPTFGDTVIDGENPNFEVFGRVRWLAKRM